MLFMYRRAFGLLQANLYADLYLDMVAFFFRLFLSKHTEFVNPALRGSLAP